MRRLFLVLIHANYSTPLVAAPCQVRQLAGYAQLDPSGHGFGHASNAQLFVTHGSQVSFVTRFA